MNPDYTIIIATRNDEEAIAKVLCSIPPEVSGKSEIIVVDSSSDMTPVIAQRLGAKVIIEKGKGKGRAMKTGVMHSKGNVLIFLDGDGTDPPQFIPKLLRKLEHSNLVLGSRSMGSFKIDDPMMRRLFKLYAPLSVRPLFRLVGFKVSGDPLAGFRAIRRKDWNLLNLESNGFEIEAEMNVKSIENKFIVKEVPIPHLRRGGGMSKSKLAGNPKAWFRILNVAIKYIGDKKLQTRLILLRKRFEEMRPSIKI